MSPPRSRIPLLVIIYLGFISLGLPDGTMGVAWPEMHQTLHLPIGLAGTLLLLVTLLAAISGFFSGRIIRRFHTGPVMLASCALTGGALLLISQSQNLAWLLAAAFPLGFGAGAVDAGLNGFVARHYSGRHMNWLHACWGIGATCGPLIVARALATPFGWRGGYLVLGSAQLALSVLFLFTLRLWDTVPEVTPGKTTGSTAAPGGSPTLPANSAAGWLSALIFALYVGVEGTAGLWLATILVETRHLTPAAAGLCGVVYYGSITGGRILVGIVVDRWGNRRLVSAGVALAVLGGFGFALAPGAVTAAAALLVLGLGFSPIYPGLMHEVPKRFAPDAVQAVIGRQSGASYIGGALLPAAAGALAGWSLPAIAWCVAVGTLLLAFCIHRLNRLT